MGDPQRDAGARVKYGGFFAALARHFSLVGTYDAQLQGRARLLNALRTVHPDRDRWRERFYKNVPAFIARSRRVAAYLRTQHDNVDLVLQLGTLFDSCWTPDGALPSLIYTDFTAHLAAQHLPAHMSPLTMRQQQQWMALERQALARAAHVCTRSQLVRRSLITDYGLAPERLTAVGGGINFPQLPDPGARRGDDQPTLLFIGKEFYRKGGDVLLRAFAQVRASLPAARLLLVTAGPVPGHLPRDGVELIAPTWDRQRIAVLYGQAHLFVLPSRLETWGDVLLEAMAYGLPGIGVTGQPMQEIIEHQVTGLLVPPEDSEALALAITRLLGDARLREAYGAAARARAGAHYRWDCVVERMVPIVAAILSQSEPDSRAAGA